jgi:hypothetical protein
MPGLMQDWPLLCHRIMELAAQVHGHQEVVDFPRQINRENNSMNRNLPRSIREFRVGQLPAPSRYALILQKQTFVGGSTLIPVASNPPLSESFGTGNPFQSPIGDEPATAARFQCQALLRFRD